MSPSGISSFAAIFGKRAADCFVRAEACLRIAQGALEPFRCGPGAKEEDSIAQTPGNPVFRELSVSVRNSEPAVKLTGHFVLRVAW